MSNARARLSNLLYQDKEPLIQFWIATLISLAPVWRSQRARSNNEEFSNTDILEYLDLNNESIRKQATPPEELDRFLSPTDLDGMFAANETHQIIRHITRPLALSECEMRILSFGWHLNTHSLVNQSTDGISSVTRKTMTDLLSIMIGFDSDSVRHAVRPTSTLFTCDLLRFRNSEHYSDLKDMLDVDYQLSELLGQHNATPEQLMQRFFRFAEPAKLKMDDYAHCQYDLDIMRTILRDALDQKRAGVNLLIHGNPGTGKTELAHLLAAELGLPLAIVPEMDFGGEALPAFARLGRLNACQMALTNHPGAVILFDESEDTLLYGQTNSPSGQKREISKASLTRVLETNRSPVIWISNHIYRVDDALLRRFTHLLRLDTPGPQHRRRVLDKYLGSLPVSEVWRQRATEIRELSPAMLEAAARIGNLCESVGEDPQRAMSRNLDARLDALDSQQRLRTSDALPLPWRAECLNASDDVASLMRELKPGSHARLCLYGPPGTGKTAWARQLAEVLKQPLMVKQATDLVSPFVGITERLIAQAFREAEEDQALLLIDEADSFISSRNLASRNWEVSQVNQFLTCMEQHRGLFIATTNRLDQVDEAAMRRFDFRIHFNYLNVEGAMLLTRDLANRFDIALPDEATLHQALKPITTLAPGDFAAMARRLSVRQPVQDFEGLLTLLKNEVAYKSPVGRAIGFHR